MIKRQSLRTIRAPTPLSDKPEEMLKLRPITPATPTTTPPEADPDHTPVMPEHLRLIPEK